MSIVISTDNQYLSGYIINSFVIVDYITKISQDQPGRTDSRSCKSKYIRLAAGTKIALTSTLSRIVNNPSVEGAQFSRGHNLT